MLAPDASQVWLIVSVSMFVCMHVYLYVCLPDCLCDSMYVWAWVCVGWVVWLAARESDSLTGYGFALVGSL